MRKVPDMVDSRFIELETKIGSTWFTILVQSPLRVVPFVGILYSYVIESGLEVCNVTSKNLLVDWVRTAVATL